MFSIITLPVVIDVNPSFYHAISIAIHHYCGAGNMIYFRTQVDTHPPGHVSAQKKDNTKNKYRLNETWHFSM